MELRGRKIEADRDAEVAFEALYGGQGDAFWLDSSRIGAGARFSFIGAPGPLGARISYDVEAAEVRVERGGEVELRGESIFDYLERELCRLRLPAGDLPFDFNCGFVGYLGYELKAGCGGAAAHRAGTADAALLFADRVIAFDHEDGRIYLLCLAEPGGEEAAERWLAETEERLATLPEGAEDPAVNSGPLEPVGFGLARSRERYLEDIAACERRLRDGESYEICLTNRVLAALAPAPLPLYRALRELNPAPYAAFLRLGQTAVLSSSPERFLRIDPRAGWRRSRSRGPRHAARPRRRTPAWPRPCAATRRTGPRT